MALVASAAVLAARFPLPGALCPASHPPTGCPLARPPARSLALAFFLSFSLARWVLAPFFFHIKRRDSDEITFCERFRFGFIAPLLLYSTLP